MATERKGGEEREPAGGREAAGSTGDEVNADRERASEAVVEPDRTRGSDRGGSGGWGNEGSGGSVIDKRSPDSK